MKKLNLFLIALTCAALCFVGCKNPSSSGDSEVSGTPLDLTQEFGDWIVGTWDMEGTKTTAIMGHPDTKSLKSKFTFEGKNDTDSYTEILYEDEFGKYDSPRETTKTI